LTSNREGRAPAVSYATCVLRSATATHLGTPSKMVPLFKEKVTIYVLGPFDDSVSGLGPTGQSKVRYGTARKPAEGIEVDESLGSRQAGLRRLFLQFGQ
jgi:hypothetical protein